MRNFKPYAVAAAAILSATFIPAQVCAQNARAAADGERAANSVAAIARPVASVADMTWLEGEWVGTGIGGNPAGESFSFAGDRQMIGHFWQLDAGGDVDFYEVITITRDGDSLMMRLKHFAADLSGWEDKSAESALNFPLLERGERRWVFGPATFTKPSDDTLEVSVVVRGSDGKLNSLDFSYRRALKN